MGIVATNLQNDYISPKKYRCYNLIMATKQSTADFIADQVSEAGEIRTRKMFGEYALYCDQKTVGFICDDTLFIKPTKNGEKFLDLNFHGAPAYPGSKKYLKVPEDKWDDREWLTSFVKATADSLPLPKRKKQF